MVNVMSPMWIPFSPFLLVEAVPYMHCVALNLYADATKDYAAIPAFGKVSGRHTVVALRLQSN